MEKKLNNKLEEIINYIIESKEYKNCIKYKEEMNNNNYLKELVNKIKKLQKEYIKTNNSNIKKELDELELELYKIDIYNKYNHNLEKVNQMINYVKEELNEYFDNILNENTNNY